MTVPVGWIIKLVFDSFDIEDHSTCANDYVEVSYGYADGYYSEKFCGNSPPGPFTSPGENMTVRMHTNGDVQRNGFHAVWEAAPAPQPSITFKGCKRTQGQSVGAATKVNIHNQGIPNTIYTKLGFDLPPWQKVWKIFDNFFSFWGYPER